MSFNETRICLISMPFSPVIMPSLGISTLKATLTGRGISTDLYYGSFEFFRTFYGSEEDPRAALFDYNFIASSTDLGNTFFADALWSGSTSAVRPAFR